MIPCPDCCASCTVATDDFNRADSTTIGGGWSEDAGDFAIVSNQLVTDDANAIAINSATLPSGRGIVESLITSSTNGAIARIIGARIDANNYLFAEVQFNTTQISTRLFRRVSGTNTQIGSTHTVSGTGTGDVVRARLCWTGSAANITVYDGSAVVGNRTGATTLNGTQGGLGTGGTTGGDIIFDDWSLQNDSAVDSCETCLPCSPCSGQIPSAWEIEFLDTTGTPWGACAGEVFVVPNQTGCRGVIALPFAPCLTGYTMAVEVSSFFGTTRNNVQMTQGLTTTDHFVNLPGNDCMEEVSDTWFRRTPIA